MGKPEAVPASNINSERARSAPHDHWTISNRMPIYVGMEMALMGHRIRIVEMPRCEDCYTECVVEVIGKESENAKDLVYA